MAMMDMITQHIIPSIKTAQIGPLNELQSAVQDLKNCLEDIHDEKNLVKKVRNYIFVAILFGGL